MTDGRTKDPRPIGRVAIALIWVALLGRIGLAAGALATIAAQDALARGDAASDALATASSITDAAALVYLATLVLAAGAVLRWIFIVNRNAHALSTALRITPLWSVLWFFVPVAGLIRPFTALSQCWRATIAPAAPEDVGVPPILRWWWAFWLLSVALDNVTLRLADGHDGASAVTGAWVTIAGAMVAVPLTATLTAVILQLSRRQNAVLARRTVSRFHMFGWQHRAR